MAQLPYKVECYRAAYWEVIAAFDCAYAAIAYVKECETANPKFKYQVKKGKTVLSVTFRDLHGTAK